MTATERIELRRRFPSRPLGRLVWLAMLGSGLVLATWLLFGTEPPRLESGQRNPLALIPLGAIVMVSALAAPLLLALVRRPSLAADHYALTVRPGMLRTLVLPWAHTAELAAAAARDEPFLLVRCDGRRDQLGDRPHWWDQAALRAARSGNPALAAYDLAVRLEDFAGTPREQFGAVAAWAPRHVQLFDDLP